MEEFAAAHATALVIAGLAAIALLMLMGREDKH